MSTNFNLISPSDNGHEFNVRYNEPIVIAPNSSVMLNWAIFERDRDIIFKEAQKFTIAFNKCLPSHHFQAIHKSNQPTVEFTIDAGTYSISELQDQITTKLLADGKLFCASNPTDRGITGVPLGPLNVRGDAGVALQGVDIICDSYDYTTPIKKPNETALNIGFCFNGNRAKYSSHLGLLRQREAMTDAGRSPHQANIEAQSMCILGEAQTGGKIWYASSNSANPDVKAFTNGSYCLTSAKYFHIGYDADTYNQVDINDNRVNVGGVDEFRDNNNVTFELNKKPSDLNGRVFVGFYPEEMGGIVSGSQANYDQQCHAEGAGVYTEHATLRYTNFRDDDGDLIAVPQCLGGLIFDEDGVDVIGKPFDNIAECKSGMLLIDSLSYTDIGLNMTANEDVTWGIQIYRPNLSVLNGQYEKPESSELLFVRCFYKIAGGATRIWYDSDYTNADARWSFSKAFQNEFLNNNTSEAKVRAQLPFNVLCSATNAGEGIETLSMTAIKHNGNSGKALDTNTERYITPTIVESYSLTMTKQLADLILISRNETHTFSPKNPTQMGINTLQLLYRPFDTAGHDILTQFYQFNNIIAQYKTDKFTIYLNELPIKVYQNTSDKSKSGNRRNILSNIPNPFGGAEVYDNGGGLVIGNYVPSLGVQNFLANQLMTTNNFSISIRNMDDDTSATQVKRCVINFSIMAPQR
jgi:hypothetical protein